MSDLQKMVAGPIIVTLKGKEYTFSPLTVFEWSAYDAWAKNEKIRGLKEALADEDPKTRATFVANAALKPLTAEEKSDIQGGMTGMIHMLCLAVQEAHKGMTEEEVGRLFGPEDMDEIERISYALGWADEKDKKEKIAELEQEIADLQGEGGEPDSPPEQSANL